MACFLAGQVQFFRKKKTHFNPLFSTSVNYAEAILDSETVEEEVKEKTVYMGAFSNKSDCLKCAGPVIQRS